MKNNYNNNNNQYSYNKITSIKQNNNTNKNQDWYNILRKFLWNFLGGIYDSEENCSHTHIPTINIKINLPRMLGKNNEGEWSL